MLRAVRVTPAAWPDLDMECRADANALGAMQAGILAHDRMVEAAACRHGNVLVFWPPLRHTYTCSCALNAGGSRGLGLGV